MKKTIWTAFLILAPVTVLAQDPAQVQKLFEAGQYQQVVESTRGNADPAVLYTAAQSQQKLGAVDQAVELYGRLAERSSDDPWSLVGRSARQLVQDDANGALESANRAVSIASNMPEAHYQLGLVLAKLQRWREAAAAFDRASELNPSLAYAHYYGGLMHYRANRPDRMAIHFEQFLKLAPEAPERPEVNQIMRTVRGR
ncbi:MAG TPA: tetratricopeptide repeat protein [Vicinamibacterales bacterium]|nr:tetratricopeptide repeat protein [Vicinamibacterales bacterium]